MVDHECNRQFFLQERYYDEVGMEVQCGCWIEGFPLALRTPSLR